MVKETLVQYKTEEEDPVRVVSGTCFRKGVSDWSQKVGKDGWVRPRVKGARSGRNYEDSSTEIFVGGEVVERYTAGEHDLIQRDLISFREMLGDLARSRIGYEELVAHVNDWLVVRGGGDSGMHFQTFCAE